MDKLKELIESSLQPLHEKIDKIDKEIQDTKDALANSVEAIAIAKTAKEDSAENKIKIEEIEARMKTVETKTELNAKMIDEMSETMDLNKSEMDKKLEEIMEKKIEENKVGIIIVIFTRFYSKFKW